MLIFPLDFGSFFLILQIPESVSAHLGYTEFCKTFFFFFKVQLLGGKYPGKGKGGNDLNWTRDSNLKDFQLHCEVYIGGKIPDNFQNRK